MCEHPHFKAQVAVHRLTDDAGPGSPVTGYSADVRVECVACGEPFTFLGVSAGVSRKLPMCSVDGTEARMPIQPRSADSRFTGPTLTRPDPRQN